MAAEIVEHNGEIHLRPANNWQQDAIRSGCDETRGFLRTGRENQLVVSRAEKALAGIAPTLRSKPDNPKKLAEVLLAGAQEPNSVGIVAVLASPTAIKEASYFIDCANELRRSIGTSELDVILMRWENIGQDLRQTERARNEDFQHVAENIRHQITSASWDPDRLHVSDVVVTHEEDEVVISSPQAFALADEAVRRAAAQREQGTNPKQLQDDLTWTINYYAKQTSLSRLGARQPLFDLALRREIGRAVSEGTLWCGRRLRRNRLCLTSELIPRIVKCYRLEIVNLNISVARPNKVSQRKQIKSSSEHSDRN